MPYQKTSVQLPQPDIANAPGQPIYISSGIFKDQYFYGDESYGGIQRIFLEKIENEYQGCVFRFAAGFTGGVSRLAFAPNGDLIVGEIGDINGGNWLEINKQIYGLHKLKPNGKSTFEMLAIRSRPKGLEIEFTEPIAANANLTNNYQVKSWYYTRTSEYGGSKLGNKNLSITSAQVSLDRKKVYLEISGLEKDRIVYVRLTGLLSSGGKSAWTTEGWYTLNAFGTGNPFDTVATALHPNNLSISKENFHVSQVDHKINFRISVIGSYTLQVRTMLGKIKFQVNGNNNQAHSLNSINLSRGNYLVTLKSQDGQTVIRPIAVF